MKQSVFINMQVQDLKKSMAFFKGLGYKFNKQFTNEEAASLVISDTIYCMLITPKRFKEFIPGRQASDSKKSTEVLLALNFDSRKKVDAFFNKAIKLGASEFRPAEDHGFMYARSFSDLDGHVWEQFWMDPKMVKEK